MTYIILVDMIMHIYIYIYAPPNELVVLKYYYSHLIYKRNMTK
jgi:hypothetical protein